MSDLLKPEQTPDTLRIQTHLEHSLAKDVQALASTWQVPPSTAARVLIAEALEARKVKGAA